jgi:predicted enzyme related to lactoylglutathione lyase
MAIGVDLFEIPVKDMGRAVEFYGSVFAEPLGTMDGPDGPMHIFPGEEGANGALTLEDSTPAVRYSKRKPLLVVLDLSRASKTLKATPSPYTLVLSRNSAN